MTPEVALVFSGLFSLIVTLVLAALGWRVKDSQDTKISTLNSRLDLQLHKSKMTFEKEFDLLSRLWAAFTDLFLYGIALGSASDPEFLSRESAQRIEHEEHAREEFAKRFFAFCKLYQENRPFYPQSIYEILDEFARLTSPYNNLDEQLLPQTEELTRYHQLNDKRLCQMDSINYKLCQAIRKEMILA